MNIQKKNKISSLSIHQRQRPRGGNQGNNPIYSSLIKIPWCKPNQGGENLCIHLSDTSYLMTFLYAVPKTELLKFRAQHWALC